MASEIVDIFIGFSVFSLVLLMIWVMYHVGIRPSIRENNLNDRYSIIELVSLDRFAKSKGIDVDKELLRMKVLQQNQKDFKKRLQEETFNLFFNENSDKVTEKVQSKKSK